MTAYRVRLVAEKICVVDAASENEATDRALELAGWGGVINVIDTTAKEIGGGEEAVRMFARKADHVG